MDGNMSYRFGTHDDVERNRTHFLGMRGINNSELIEIGVEQGDAVVSIGTSPTNEEDHFVVAEALMTNVEGITLFLLTADCLPVVFVDSRQRAIALAHLGWKPTEKHLARKVVLEMVEKYGTNPRDLHVYIGPSIKKESYAFPTVTQTDDTWNPFLRIDDIGMTHIDLSGFNRAVLHECGVLREHIVESSVDTASSEDFFSHYGAKNNRQGEGRFATIVSMLRT